MAVYVDRTRRPNGPLMMCRMLADTASELHALASKIGARSTWYRPHSKEFGNVPHYEICQSSRARAIRRGAVEVDNRGLEGLILRLKEELEVKEDP